jgi:uncharacterized protein (DUF983 family)
MGFLPNCAGALANAAEAHRLIEENGAQGKIMLDPRWGGPRGRLTASETVRTASAALATKLSVDYADSMNIYVMQHPGGRTIVDPSSYEPSRVSAVRRGFSGRCPCCATGRMFRAFLKVRERCEVCGEELFHHRADDFPPYLVIVIVGHIVVSMILLVEIEFAPPLWLQMTLWPLVTMGLALALLQPVKGAVVALQWSLRMHGFEGRPELPAPPRETGSLQIRTQPIAADE